MSNGKGDTRRPRAITSAEEAQRWDATFGPPRDDTVCTRLGCGLPGTTCDHSRGTVKERDT